MKPRRFFAGRSSPKPARRRLPRQMDLSDFVTMEAVAGAFDRQTRRRTEGKSWEDNFAFHVHAHRLPTITRKFLFAKQALGRKWEADFAYPEWLLLIEIEGGVWRRGGGAHSHPSNIERDMQKQNDATLLGYHVLRFTSDQVKHGDAIEFLKRVLAQRGWQEHEAEKKRSTPASHRAGAVPDGSGDVVLRQSLRD